MDTTTLARLRDHAVLDSSEHLLAGTLSDPRNILPLFDLGNLAEVTQDAVAGRFKQARLDLGLTQADVVRDTGLTRNYVSRFERCVQVLNLSMLCYLHSQM